jgi:S-adenosylmethionine-diacylglycerol 3-amino-3-carboxypropyl transferase
MSEIFNLNDYRACKNKKKILKGQDRQSEVFMKRFFTRLSYSFGNEDFRTESKALQLQDNDEVLVVTASGDRPLNILSMQSKKVYAIDANPIQNALLDLKMAALKHFDYEKYIAFLGLSSCNHRKQLYASLKSSLQPTTLSLLKTYEKKIDKGIIYQGTVEKGISIASIAIRAVRGNKVQQLFSFDTVREQAHFVEKHWDTPGWRNIVKLAVNPYVGRLFWKDPGLYEYIGSDINSVNHVYNRFHSSLVRFLAKENILLSLCLQGKVYEAAYPPYLCEQESNKIRNQLDKIEHQTIDLLSYLRGRSDKSLDAFSLSDVASYLSQEEFSIMMKEMVRTARSGARFCIRQFLCNHALPEEILPFLKRDTALEKELENEDRCFVYRFMAGSIQKP